MHKVVQLNMTAARTIFYLPAIGFFFFALLSLPVQPAASTYWVAPSGSDDNPGTQSQPLRTIQEGLDRARAGDTVVVRPGVYRSGARFRRSGAGDAPITLRAEFPAVEHDAGRRAVIRGADGDAVHTRGHDHLIVDGLELSRNGTGMRIKDGSDRIVVRRNVFDSNSGANATLIRSSNVVFERNHFLDPDDLDAEGKARSDYDINIFFHSPNITIRNNYFMGRGHQKISVKRYVPGPTLITHNTFEGCHRTCIYVGQHDDDTRDQTSTNIAVTNNVFRDVHADGEYYRLWRAVVLRNVRDVVVGNNFVENAQIGIAVYQPNETANAQEKNYGIKPGNSLIYGNTITYTRYPLYIQGRGYGGDDVKIANNTLYKSDSGVRVLDNSKSWPGRETTDPPNITWRNNNFVDVDFSGNFATSSFSHNNFHSAGPRRGTAALAVEPRFRGPTARRDARSDGRAGFRPSLAPDFSRAQGYTLQDSSGLVGAGGDVGLPFDGAAPDIGSNEFIGGRTLWPPRTGAGRGPG